MMTVNAMAPPKVVVERPGLSYRTQVHIEPGAQTRITRVVAESDTALLLGTGDVPVVATSRVLAWCEEASFRAMADSVPDGSTSVAMRVQIDHIRAASVGCEITAIATLERIEGRRYLFVVTAIDPNGDALAEGRVVRVMVDTASFLAKACGTPE